MRRPRPCPNTTLCVSRQLNLSSLPAGRPGAPQAGRRQEGGRGRGGAGLPRRPLHRLVPHAGRGGRARPRRHEQKHKHAAPLDRRAVARGRRLRRRCRGRGARPRRLRRAAAAAGRGRDGRGVRSPPPPCMHHRRPRPTPQPSPPHRAPPPGPPLASLLQVRALGLEAAAAVGRKLPSEAAVAWVCRMPPKRAERVGKALGEPAGGGAASPGTLKLNLAAVRGTQQGGRRMGLSGGGLKDESTPPRAQRPRREASSNRKDTPLASPPPVVAPVRTPRLARRVAGEAAAGECL